MSTDHPSIDGEDTGYHPWLATVLAGLAAGGAMGVLLSLGTGLMPSIGALYGLPSVLGGWIAHLANSLVFAFVFTLVATRPFVRREPLMLSTYAGLGVGYGAVLGLVTGGVLFPLWVNAAAGAGLPFPFVPVPGLGLSASVAVFALAHLVYGAVLGTVYALASRSVPGPSIGFRRTFRT
jgi:hypothetical protein